MAEPVVTEVQRLVKKTDDGKTITVIVEKVG
jgi:hypothetical protein